MDNGKRPQMEEADLTNPEILKYYFLLCNEIFPDAKKMGIQEFKCIKKELNERFNLDFRIVDVVNKYRDIYYKWQIWENFVNNKEFVLAHACTADVSWLQSKSEECLDTISVDKEGQPSIGLLKFVFGSSANGSKGSDSLKPTATVHEHVGDSSRDLEFHEPKTNSSNEISLDDRHNISESSKCVRLGYCPKRIKMNGSCWTRTALEDDVFQVRKTLRLVSKTCGLMSNKHFYLFTGRLLMNPRERSWFYFVEPSLRLRYLEKQFKKFSADRVIPEPTQPTGADPTVPPLAPTD
ncbi:uncharacterized protein LOC115973688 [Quercus lobata]|uniref:uncharacterized protein LOC115972877 n=1 Tax=Quercus lobata TaxID=97700 RepID=UPI0012459B7F|nr:uncharacterized protein LOC115972877 [Quercus lobata]XP_030949810.1 uncharacterized protein LOC115973688 [Quercus lobata]